MGVILVSLVVVLLVIFAVDAALRSRHVGDMPDGAEEETPVKVPKKDAGRRPLASLPREELPEKFRNYTPAMLKIVDMVAEAEQDSEEDDDDGPIVPAWQAAIGPIPGVILKKSRESGRSKMGGDPNLPAALEWPKTPDGVEMAFLTQIHCPDLPTGLGFPETGTLFFFIDPDWGFDMDDKENPLHYRVFYTDLLLPDSPRPRTTPLPKGVEPYREMFVRAEAVESIPGKSEKWDDYRSPVYRMLGHPDYIQIDEDTPAPPPGRMLLLQIDSDESPDGPGWMWGDMGMLYFFIDREDLKAGRFENVLLEEECY